jgi:P4 family phage/plasmid primase-like protien
MLTVTVGRGAQSSAFERRTLSLEALFDRLRQHAIEPLKEQSECIIPGFVAECPTPCRQSGRTAGVDCGGGQIHRLAANVRTVEALFLDFDNWNTQELEAALIRVDASGYRYICYSSPSYAPPDKAKVRIVFPLAHAYDVQDPKHWREQLWPALVRTVGLPDADRACSDVSRLYYLPSKPRETATTLLREGGTKVLDLPVMATTLRLVVPTPRAASSEELIAQLRADVDYPPDVELVEAIADGAALATEQGGRHPAILRATWLLARLSPPPTTECVETLLSASCAAMGDERDFLAEAVRAYETAQDKVAEDLPEAEDFRARLEEQVGTDKAFALRLVRERGDDARFLPAAGWHVWDGKRFRSWGDRPLTLVASLRDGYEADLAALKARIREIDEQLKSNGPAGTVAAQDAARRLAEKRNALSEKAEKFYKTCIRPTQTVASASAVLRVAEDMAPFRSEPDAFDADPSVLNCENGMVDLHTGALRPHDPNALCTMLAPVCYEPTATAPLFERVLAEALPDPEVRAFFHRVTGYSITGDVSEDLMFLLLGSGGNGKSTVLNAIAATLGDYAGVTSKALLVKGGKMAASKDYELADLRGKRFVQVMELSDREYLDSGKLKSVVGGDRITAARKYENAITFKTQAKILMACNEKPRVTDDDNGAWRRIALIDFPNAFIEAPDRTITQRLAAEREGIFAWAVRGCLEWRRQGMNVPAVAREQVAEYRKGENDVVRFVEERIERAADGFFPSAPLYSAYRDWATDNGSHPMDIRKFTRRMQDLGFSYQRKHDARGWLGVNKLLS